MGLSRYSPATEPTLRAVGLDELKTHLRITNENEDAYLLDLLNASTSYVEAMTGRQLITATYDYKIGDFSESIRLPKPPLSTVSSVKYYDSNGVEQTVSASVYQAITDEAYGRIVLAPDQSWPSPQEREEAVTIRFVAGYGSTPDAVPAALRQAIMFLCSHWYENREAVDLESMANVKEIPFAFRSLIWAYKVPRFA